MNIDKSKLVEYLEKEKSIAIKEKSFLLADNIRHTLNKINSGEFDCEAVGSKWKPKVGDRVCYMLFDDVYDANIIVHDVYDDKPNIIVMAMFNSGWLFKTEADCKQYMNAKGWYNEKQWELT